MSDVGPTVAFTTLGCKVNRAEAERFAAEAVSRGALLCSQEESEVVVVTACAVTAEASHKSRKAVRHALGLANSPTVIVTGCMTEADKAKLAALSPRVVVVSDKDEVGPAVAEAAGLTGEVRAEAIRSGDAFRTRALVKVQDGCDNRCAYCIVPNLRGRPRSVPVIRVLEEVRSLVDAGVNEVVLTGINIGRYDDGGCGLGELISRVATTGVRRIRLTSIEPVDITERFVETVASVPAFVEHVHVPLQSGCDKTLAAMGRRYTTDEFERALTALRDVFPGIALTTDVICGYPGESDPDALESESFVQRMGFAKLHVFRYSRRPGTRAAQRTDVVDPATVAARAARMRAIGRESQRVFLHRLIGRGEEVLVESTGGGVAVGTARCGARARVERSAAQPGELVRVVVLDADGATLVCRPAEGRGGADRATIEPVQ